MTLQEFLKATYDGSEYCIRPRIVCNDGFSMSVQASVGRYCDPRESLPNGYETVEIGFPDTEETLIMDYIECWEDSPTGSVYPYVPVEVVEQVIEKHGGIANQIEIEQ